MGKSVQPANEKASSRDSGTSNKRPRKDYALTEENKVEYWEGDYLIPDLVPPESPHIGVWGERRRQYLRTVKQSIYTGMLLSGTLNAHLEETNRAAEEMLVRLIRA